MRWPRYAVPISSGVLGHHIPEKQSANSRIALLRQQSDVHDKHFLIPPRDDDPADRLLIQEHDPISGIGVPGMGKLLLRVELHTQEERLLFGVPISRAHFVDASLARELGRPRRLERPVGA